jgi:hypothetical protein
MSFYGPPGFFFVANMVNRVPQKPFELVCGGKNLKKIYVVEFDPRIPKLRSDLPYHP